MASLGSAKYKDAVESLTQAVAVNPQDAIAYAKLGVAYSALGDHKPAITAFKQAIKLNRAFVDADSYFRLGISYLALSDYASAIDPLKQALYGIKAKVLEDRTKSTAGPGEAEINDALGRAYYGTGSYRQAVKAFETAVRLKPDFASSHYGLGLSYWEVGDKRSAENEEHVLRKLNSRLADRLAGMFIVPAGQRNKVF
jgi:tetratricopeptide (TPR) repeat protein